MDERKCLVCTGIRFREGGYRQLLLFTKNSIHICLWRKNYKAEWNFSNQLLYCFMHFLPKKNKICLLSFTCLWHNWNFNQVFHFLLLYLVYKENTVSETLFMYNSLLSQLCFQEITWWPSLSNKCSWCSFLCFICFTTHFHRQETIW